jgi:UDP-galactopyranose mutase
LGFYGVIDERIDFGLLAATAEARPEWSIVMLGPISKIGEHELARRPNIFYLGAKPYGELPGYLAGWHVGLMPFAINEATRFISPTKTPEYLAGGVAVVATPIRDVVRQYGDVEGVFIGDTPAAFIDACEQALKLKRGNSFWLSALDAVLANASWDRIFARMEGLVADAVMRRRSAPAIAAA